MKNENEIVLFESKDGNVTLPVSVDVDTVWLSRKQMAKLFDKDRTVIGRHIKNAIDEGEINPTTMCAKYAHMGKEADQVYQVDIYNLDVIISVGYRVKSQRGVEFRRWATSVLKEYLIKGYAVNQNRLRQLDQTVEIMKRVSNSLDAEQILDVVKTYSSALDLLDGYDHQTIEKPKVKGRSVELTYEDCRKFIDGMKFAADSPLFGNEKDGSFKSKTSHTLNPVPCIIYDNFYSENYTVKADNGQFGLANVAATVVTMMGYEAPVMWEKSMITLK